MVKIKNKNNNKNNYKINKYPKQKLKKKYNLTKTQ